MPKSKLRAFQDEMRNRGWRIEWIVPVDGNDVQRHPTNRLALVGVAGFLGGLALFGWYVASQGPAWGMIGLPVAVGSLALVFFSVWWQARTRRRNWVQADARCVDREFRQVRVQHGLNWEARLVCEFQANGKNYRATPAVHYCSFRTEDALQQYIDERVTPNGQCRLFINPANPLECELVGQGLKDTLLH